MPQRVNAKVVDDVGALCMYFDGGCSCKSPGKPGAGGYVVFVPQGNLLAGRGVFVGPGMTNNTSESRGLVCAIECVDELLTRARYPHVVVL